MGFTPTSVLYVGDICSYLHFMTIETLGLSSTGDLGGVWRTLGLPTPALPTAVPRQRVLDAATHTHRATTVSA